MKTDKNKRWLKTLFIVFSCLMFAFLFGRAFIKWSGVTSTNPGFKYLQEVSGKYSNSGFIQGCFTETYLRSMGLDSEESANYIDRYAELVLNHKFDDVAVRSEIVLGAEKLGFKLDKDAKPLPSDAITLEFDPDTLLVLMRNKSDGRLKVGLTYFSTAQSRSLSQALFICLP